MQQLPEAREDTFGIGGLSLHYATWGSFTSPERTVLLVHGLTASHRTWAELGPQLAARGWYVIAADLRGRGLSSKPKRGYNVGVHVADLLALCEKLGAERVNIVGHSLGAVIAMYAAAFFPRQVSKIALVDAGGKIPDDTAQAIAASLNRLGMTYPSLEAYLSAMSQLPMITWNPFWEQYFRYDAEVQPDGTVVSRVPRSAIDEESAALYFTRSEALPSFVKCLTLIVRAELGTLGPDKGVVLPREEAERLRSIIPDSQLIEIPATNHYTVTLAPVFTDAVTTFLETPSGAPVAQNAS